MLKQDAGSLRVEVRRQVVDYDDALAAAAKADDLTSAALPPVGAACADRVR